jgi:hypothetical protein
MVNDTRPDNVLLARRLDFIKFYSPDCSWARLPYENSLPGRQ